MSARYAPIPNPHTDPNAENELEAAFDDSDDEEDDSHPLSTNRRNGGYQSLPNAEPPSSNLFSQQEHEQRQHAPGTYDFENVEFDYIRPPPGSPPSPSTRALPNPYGNTNGTIPSLDSVPTNAGSSRGGWFGRAARTILPTHYVERLGLAPQVPRGPVGGGIHNDGVFANVTAKPSRAVEVREGDEVFLVPEESQRDAPPSYAAAQADSVPPYWETTIHAPSSSNTPGEMIIDGLPTGSLFSFLWNMLVSISFQFVGFLLTYLLHTTHAAKMGSRAGLGVTLIQYGFAMRSRTDEWLDNGDNPTIDGWGTPPEPKPIFETPAEAEEWYKNFNTTSVLQPSTPVPNSQGGMFGDAAAEWLSFFLMTIGWFLLLTSLLGFWRVKRWERSILSSQASDNTPSSMSDSQARNNALAARLERAFGIRGLADGSLVRTGLGFPGAHSHTLFDAAEPEEEESNTQPTRGEYVIPVDPSTVEPEQAGRLVRALQDEANLARDLRSAGLL
ncbi:hypothetical protein K474DRAFT_1753433 [Panus rudis PR-1116 ss-1]|nr:hypothetical protein K474DRAFT_1753433 [Panus rudis PR-1116 ss-1]